MLQNTWRAGACLGVAAALWLGTSGAGWAESYTVDSAASSVGFKVGFAFGTVRGTFHEVDGRATITDGRLESVTAVIQTASIDTKNGTRDKHLRSSHFFHAEKYPALEFKSLAVPDGTGDDLRLRGTLTIRGVSKEVELHGSLKAEGGRYLFQAETEVNRQDWGLSWNQHTNGMDLFIKDIVTLVIQGELVPAS